MRIHKRHTNENLSDLRTDPKSLLADHPRLISELTRLCREAGSMGITANQVGLKENFFFVTSDAKFPNKRGGGKPSHHLCCNPTWSKAEKSRESKGVEGSVSFPGLLRMVKRFTVIEAKWDNLLGHRQEMTLRGVAARVFQHECAMLRGELDLRREEGIDA